VDGEGSLSEIPESRETIGSVIGLDVDSDGALYVLDRVEALTLSGAVIWRITEGDIAQIATLPAEGTRRISLPNDIAIDDAGNIYVTDVDSALRRIWRFAPGADSGEIWWIAPQDPANPAGLAYDSTNQRLLVTDVAGDAIYAIPLDAEDPSAATETIYRYDGPVAETPGFNGLTVAPDGTIYVAELGQNQVSRLEDGELVALAGGYRGSSDVAYDATSGRIFVNNWDQSWLTPVQFFIVRFYVDARLPFSVDVVETSE
jgi:sugar lactone lactonase YvrE